MSQHKTAPSLILLTLAGLANVAFTFVAIRAHDASDHFFLAIVTAQSGLALAAVPLVCRCSPGGASFVVVSVAIAIRIVLLFTAPLLSDDVYRYVWDGRVVNAGFNPYLHVPADPTLLALRDDAVWPHVDKKDYAVTIYPPVAQLLFATVTRVADGLLAMKLAMLAFEALAIAAMLSLLRQLKKSPRSMVLYLWHPFSPWEIANNAHADAAVAGLAFAGLAFVRYGRAYWLAGLLTAAALVKPFAALFLPSTWRPFDLRLPVFVLTLVAILYVPFAWSAGFGVFGFLGKYAEEQGLSSGNGLFFVQLAARAGARAWTREAYLAGAGILLLALAIGMAWRPVRDLAHRLVEDAVLSLTFLFLLTPVYPWYALLVAPFATLLGSWCAAAMMTTGFWLYSFNADQVDFSYRWSASVAVVAAGGAIDLCRLWRARSAMSAS